MLDSQFFPTPGFTNLTPNEATEKSVVPQIDNNNVESSDESISRAIELATCQLDPRSFRVADDSGEVCMIHMAKRCFRLGDDVSGIFSFGDMLENVCTQVNS